MAGPESTTIRIDMRAALPVLALAFVVLLIIFVELCGKTDIKPVAPEGTPFIAGPTSTPGPSPTEGPSATPEPAEATATLESASSLADRDEVRQTDLHTIQDALEQYFDENGEYPSTGGGIQTICAFEDDDKGCALKEVLDPIPFDPLESPGANGYWLQSTETSYTIYSQRESTLFEACPEKPAHLEEFRSVFCLQNP